MIALEDVKKNEELNQLILSSQKQLNALGYTEHSIRHMSIVSQRAGELLTTLDYPAERIELAKIAGYMHDIGNCVNRVDHAHTGAILAYQILKDMGMNVEQRTEIMMAIGNHDEQTGTAVSDISAALILADKSDAHRSRVVNQNISTFDKHDKVNYAVTDSKFIIDKGIGIVYNNESELQEIFDLMVNGDLDHRFNFMLENLVHVKKNINPEKIGDYVMELL